jgi:hypothetical protein
MYSRVDVSWNAHRLDDNNSLLWNRTNRFYEACAFHKPMVAQIQSQDGRVVATRQLGPCIDLMDVEASATSLLGVSWNDLAEWQNNLAGLPSSIYTENGEHEELARRLLTFAHAV